MNEPTAEDVFNSYSEEQLEFIVAMLCYAFKVKENHGYSLDELNKFNEDQRTLCYAIVGAALNAYVDGMKIKTEKDCRDYLNAIRMCPRKYLSE